MLWQDTKGSVLCSVAFWQQLPTSVLILVSWRSVSGLILMVPTVEIIVENHYAPRCHASHYTPKESTIPYSLVNHLTFRYVSQHNEELHQYRHENLRQQSASTKDSWSWNCSMYQQSQASGAHLGLPRTPASWIQLNPPSAPALKGAAASLSCKASSDFLGLYTGLLGWFLGGMGVGWSPGAAAKQRKAGRTAQFSFAFPI